jgi:protein-S-isoprenylcysteine O-methyltransferase Ste14
VEYVRFKLSLESNVVFCHCRACPDNPGVEGKLLNKVAEFVFNIAMKQGRRRFLWSVAGAVFWYGAVYIMVILAPWLDKTWRLTLSISSLVRLPVGIILLVLGVPMIVWTITRFLRTKGTPIPFNPPPTMVTNGLYNIIRNPMHLGWTLVLFGVAVLMQSFTLLVIFIPLFVLAHILYLKLIEEKELEKKFGQAYLDYKKRVPMFIPKLFKLKIERPY